jgi:hypothetical protein
MNEVTFYITLSSDVALRSEKEISQSFGDYLKNILGERMGFLDPEPYADFATKVNVVFQNKRYCLMWGKVLGGESNEWVVAPHPPRVSFLARVLPILDSSREVEYAKFVTLIEKALSNNRNINKVDKYLEKWRI